MIYPGEDAGGERALFAAPPMMDLQQGRAQSPIHHEDGRLLHIFSDYRFIFVAGFLCTSECMLQESRFRNRYIFYLFIYFFLPQFGNTSGKWPLLINVSRRNIHIYWLRSLFERPVFIIYVVISWNVLNRHLSRFFTKKIIRIMGL